MVLVSYCACNLCKGLARVKPCLVVVVFPFTLSVCVSVPVVPVPFADSVHNATSEPRQLPEKALRVRMVGHAHLIRFGLYCPIRQYFNYYFVAHNGLLLLG